MICQSDYMKERAGICRPPFFTAPLLRHPHPGEVLRHFCGGAVGIQLSGRFPARQAGLPAVHAQRLALLCPHGLPLPPRLGAPGTVEAEEQEIKALSGAPAPALPKGEPSRKVHH